MHALEKVKMNDMIKIFLAGMMMLASLYLQAQTPKIYNPEAVAKLEIQQAVVKANAESKHVFLQIGGNWCPWCIKFHQFIQDHEAIKSFVDQNFVVLKVNYSKENPNADILEKLQFPQRFGFPVFVILDDAGNRIHTQNSAYLEENGGYSEKKVMEFFRHWAPAALQSESYKKDR